MSEMANKIKKFIKGLCNNIIGRVEGYVHTRNLKFKLNALFWMLVNILGTGIIITIILELWNTSYRFISFGLLSAIVMFYFKWFRKLIIAKTNKEIEIL